MLYVNKNKKGRYMYEGDFNSHALVKKNSTQKTFI